MSEKKQKRDAPSHIELTPIEDWGFILEPAKVEIGSGYAVSLRYDEEGNPVVDVKTYGDVDPAKIKRDIERLYPNARIRCINEEPTVTIVKKGRRKAKGKK
ncbi:MAG: hypothetical protein QXG58_02735 [Candidatus Bathyarchaeia archaeon]